MDLKEKLSKLTQIPVDQLEQKLEFKEDKISTLIIIKQELDREMFKKVAQAVQGLGGQYVKTQKLFRIANVREAAWDEVANALKSLPDDIKLSLSLELIVKTRSFMGSQKFKTLIKQIKEVGGTYVPGKDQAHFEIAVALPAVNPEKDLFDEIQYGGLTAYQQALKMQELIDKHGHTQDSIALKLKRSRSWVANHLRFMQLKNKISENLLNSMPEGVARTLLSTPEDKLDKVLEEFVDRTKKGKIPTIAELEEIIKAAK
jgi:hypothetical protein